MITEPNPTDDEIAQIAEFACKYFQDLKECKTHIIMKISTLIYAHVMTSVAKCIPEFDVDDAIDRLRSMIHEGIDHQDRVLQ